MSKQDEIIAEQDSLLSAAIQSAVDGFILISDQGIIELFNPAAERLFGYKKEEVIGQNISLLMPFEHAKVHDQHIQRYMQTGIAHIVGRGREVPAVKKGGMQFPVYLAVSEVQMEGRRAFTGILRDLTLQKEQERTLVEETMKRAMAEEQNFSISQSLKYANRIQQSILPAPEDLASDHDYFVIFKPKELVSGDFYWMFKKGEYVFLAVVDCTGHGVPGAFMSLLGYTHLNYVTQQSRSNSPAKILAHLDARIDTALGISKNGDLKDGMDIAMVRIHSATREIVFAGARRPLVLYKDGACIEIKGDRSSVGHDINSNKMYTDQFFQLNSGDSLFLFSDGITDQLGRNDTKYGKRNLMDFIASSQQMSMKELGNAIELEHYRWLHGHPQIDDITMLGVRL